MSLTCRMIGLSVRPMVPLAATPSAGYHSRRQVRNVKFLQMKYNKRRSPDYQPPVVDLGPLRFEPTVVPTLRLANGWTTPPEARPDHLPFQVFRTQPGRYLPVYAKYKNGGNRALTMVKNVDGDVACLQEELAKVCMDTTRGKPGVVRQRAGSLEVKGHHTAAVRNYLVSLGF